MQSRRNNNYLRIDGSSRQSGFGLKEIYENREVCYFIFWREIKTRYKQTVLGIAWAIIRPFMNMIVFSAIFGGLAKLPSDGVPYPIFAYCGILPWQLFSQALSATTGSLLSNRNLIDKIYFPRMIFPLASVFSSLFDFIVAFSVLLVMLIYYGIAPTWNFLALPFLVFLACGIALAVGLWLGVLSVQFRDFRQIVPFLIQFWFYATPVVYSISLIPADYDFWYRLNPMVGVVEGFRWALLGRLPFPTGAVFVSIFFLCGLLLPGIKFFQRMERTIADVV